MLLYFGLVFTAGILLHQAAEFYGIPGTGFRGEYEGQEAKQLQNLNLVADLKEERLVRWIEERHDDISVLADSGLIQPYVQALHALHAKGSDPLWHSAQWWEWVKNMPAHTMLLHYLKVVKSTYGVYEDILVADGATGIIIAATDERDLGASVAGRRFFVDALGSQAPQFSIGLEKTSGAVLLHVSRAVLRSGDPAGGGGVAAVVVADVATEDMITPFLHTGDGLGETGEVLLVNENVEIISSLKYSLPDGSRPAPLTYRIESEPARRGARGERGMIPSHDYRGVPVLAAFRYVQVTPDMGWGLVVKQDREEVYAPLRESTKSGAIAGVFALLVVLGMAVVVASGLSRPIRELSHTAQRVRGGDLGARSTVSAGGEVGILVQSFNDMVGRIQHWHEELETEVSGRTDQLQTRNEQLAAEVRERKRAEKKLERQTQELARSNADLEQFAYAASHDLQEPLRMVGSYTELLARRYQGKLDADADEFIKYTVDGVTRMRRLIDDLLTYSRAGTSGKSLSPTDSTAVLEDVLANLQVAIADSGAVITHDRLPVVMADSAQLGQVLQNLIGNAIKFCGSELTRVHVSATREGAEWVFSIRDNGPGIDSKYQEQIFLLFRRLHSQSEYPGTGMGLAICKRIIERHGGRIWVRSQPGQGTTFYFTMPGVDSA